MDDVLPLVLFWQGCDSKRPECEEDAVHGRAQFLAMQFDYSIFGRVSNSFFTLPYVCYPSRQSVEQHMLFQCVIRAAPEALVGINLRLAQHSRKCNA